MMAGIQPLLVECPECHEKIHVPLRLSLGSIREGNLLLDIVPELDDLWAHAWTHENGSTGT